VISLLFAAPAVAQDAALGQRLFIQCRACHSMAPGEHKVGPSLHGVVGKPAASTPGFAFSPALKNARLAWDDATLDRFLARPAAAAPGNKMAFAGVADPGRRAAIIAYLKTAGRSKQGETK